MEEPRDFKDTIHKHKERPAAIRRPFLTSSFDEYLFLFGKFLFTLLILFVLIQTLVCADNEISIFHLDL